jgi:acylglycerol lipase
VHTLGFRDPQKVARVEADPRLYKGRVRLRTGLQFAAAARAVQACLPHATFPFLVFHGTADAVTPPSMSIQLFETAPSADKTLVLYENAHHAIYWESERVRARVFV